MGTASVTHLLLRREVQRILMELLNQMDGFDQTVNVKVSLLPLSLIKPIKPFLLSLTWTGT